MFKGTKNQIISAFGRVGVSLTKEQTIALNNAERELVQHGIPALFVIVDVECRVCSHRQSNLAVAGADLDNLKCNNCGNMTCQEVETEKYPEEEI